MARYEVIVESDVLHSCGGLLKISGAEARHLARARRARIGASVRVKDGLGLLFAARISNVSGDEVWLELLEELPCQDDTLPLIFMPSVIKGNRMDWLMQKLCELGVREIRPVITSRTVAKSTQGSEKCRRWRSIAMQALKQCSGNILTRIHAPVSLHEAIDNLDITLKIMLYENAQGKSLMALLKAMDPAGPACILAGPEGGFSREEIGLCGNTGFVQASLGTRILRTETAAVTAAAQFMAAIQE